MSMSDQRVKVGVRVRPLLNSELDAAAESVIKAEKGKRIVATVPAKKNAFDFDWAFGQTTSHREVYDSMCKPLIKALFEGFNATVFAYGQTGSGKTYTMGNAAQATEGVIPYAVSDIFDEKARLEAAGKEVVVEMSFMEVYMEECYDLFNPDRKRIELRETPKGETVPDDLSVKVVHTPQEVQSYLAEATLIRATGCTAMNAHSSRSHAICTVYLRISDRAVPDPTDESNATVSRAIVSKLHLVDLAGSERAKKTGATGDVFAEGVSINKGLLALGNVIVALSTQNKENCNTGVNGEVKPDATGNKKNYIPYRDSKITRLLKDSLGGNGKTVMLACISPADVNFEETLNTLRFANRASTIVNSAQVNIDDSDLVMDGGRPLPASVVKELSFLRSHSVGLQNQIESLRQLLADTTGSQSSYGSQAIVDTKSIEQAQAATKQLKLVFAAINEMVNAQKGLLIKCLEDDLPLEETALRNLCATINNIMSLIASINKSDDDVQEEISEFSVLESEFLPPIMKLIEDLDKLQEKLNAAVDSQLEVETYQPPKREVARAKALPSIASEHSESRDNLMDIDGAASSNAASSADMDVDGMQMTTADAAMDFLVDGGSEYMDAFQEAESEAVMREKEVKIMQMIRIAEEYKTTIMNLRCEISSMQSEKQLLAAKEAKEPPGTTDSKIKKDLLEKSKQLEAKLKELRSKEIEYARIYQEKERARKEAETLRKELTEAMKKRVAMQKKLKEESEQHLQEKKKLQQLEIQSRKREFQAQEAVSKLSKDFFNKEKVLRGQMEEKERELKRQKELIEKQAKVKAMRDAAPARKNLPTMGLGASSMAAQGSNNAAAAASANNGLAPQRVVALQLWLSQELESQMKRNIIQEDIQLTMEARAKASRKLHQYRTQRGVAEQPLGACTGVASRNNDEVSREAEIKGLEEEVRLKSTTIAKQQGALADLGSVVEKRRFAGITDPREAKYIMSWMFQKLSKDAPLAQKSLESRVSAQEEQIEALKKQLQEKENLLHQYQSDSLDTSGHSSASGRKSVDSNSTEEMERPLGPGKWKVKTQAAQPKNTGIPNGGAAGRRKFQLQSIAKAMNAVQSSILQGSAAADPAVSASESNSKNDEVNLSGISGDDDEEEHDGGADLEMTVDLDDTYEDPYDESFRPSDEDSDDDDYKRGRKKRSNAQKQTGTVVGKKRTLDTLDLDSDDRAAKRLSPIPRAKTAVATSARTDARRRSISGRMDDLASPFVANDDIFESASKNRKLRRASVSGRADLSFVNDSKLNESLDVSFDPLSRLTSLREPLDQYKVQELKDFLASRGLPISGKKSELINRLRDFEGSRLTKA